MISNWASRSSAVRSRTALEQALTPPSRRRVAALGEVDGETAAVAPRARSGGPACGNHEAGSNASCATRRRPRERRPSGRRDRAEPQASAGASARSRTAVRRPSAAPEAATRAAPSRSRSPAPPGPTSASCRCRASRAVVQRRRGRADRADAAGRPSHADRRLEADGGPGGAGERDLDGAARPAAPSGAALGGRTVRRAARARHWPLLACGVGGRRSPSRVGWPGPGSSARSGLQRRDVVVGGRPLLRSRWRRRRARWPATSPSAATAGGSSASHALLESACGSARPSCARPSSRSCAGWPRPPSRATGDRRHIERISRLCGCSPAASG